MSPEQQFVVALVAGVPASAAAMGALVASLVTFRRTRRGVLQHEDLLARLQDLNARTLQLERVVAELEVLIRAAWDLRVP